MDSDTDRYFAPDYGTARHRFQELTKGACPDDDSWRRAVLKRGRDLLKQALDYGMLAATGGNHATSI